MEREARVRNGIAVWAGTRESDPAGVRFFEQRGFRALRRVWRSRLDLAKVNGSGILDRSASPEREGFRFSTLLEEEASSPGVRDRRYELSELTSAEIPRLGEFHPISFEEFAATDLASPGAIPEAVFLACRRSEVVGMTCLSRDLGRPDSLWVGYTGTNPAIRGRGIATEIKRRALLFAQAQGFRFLLTGNDSLNRPILAVNQRLGFRPESIWVEGEKSLETAPS
ncbi:MAG: GNAT family N-acetyltransferase [Thermoplasmata archaeon]|nr:GNAT family N-acetyltransferase [Thermoplasmata archaeon]